MAKLTKREIVSAMLNEPTIVSNADYKAYLENELVLLANKAERAKNASRKPTKAQVENEALKAEMLAYVAENASATIKAVAENFAISSQKATPLMNALVDEGKLVKVVEKRVARYSVA